RRGARCAWSRPSRRRAPARSIPLATAAAPAAAAPSWSHRSWAYSARLRGQELSAQRRRVGLDRRTGRSGSTRGDRTMPFLTSETADERDSLATFSRQQIDQIATALHGLDREQLAMVPSASGMSLGALARHVLLVAGRAVLTFATAPEAPASPSEDLQQFQAEGTIAPEALRAEDTADSLSQELRRVGEELAAAIRAADLETRGPVPAQPWFEGRE